MSGRERATRRWRSNFITDMKYKQAKATAKGGPKKNAPSKYGYKYGFKKRAAAKAAAKRGANFTKYRYLKRTIAQKQALNRYINQGPHSFKGLAKLIASFL